MKLFQLALITIFFAACANADNHNNTSTKDTLVVLHKNEPPVEQTPEPVSPHAEEAEPVVSEPEQKTTLEGDHNLTLQWISWDRPGIITFKKIDDEWYSVDGEQNINGDYVTVNGKMKQISPLELKFDGTIALFVSHNNGSKVCVKKGEQTFLSTKGRKYWRMQDMLNCDGVVTDYVDIYF